MASRISESLLSFVERRLLPPGPVERGSLDYWREMIASAILLTGVVAATLVLVPSFNLIINEQAWGVMALDLAAYAGGVILLFYRPARYEYRALYILLMQYVIGLGVISAFGPMSGGPSWLFAFAVVSGVLMGVKGAFIALGINTATLAIYGWVFGSGLIKPAFPFFESTALALSALANFIMLNTVAAVAVAVLVRGLASSQKKEKELISDLEQEQARLYQTTTNLKNEIQERVQVEQHLKGALSEKEILLREIHHRVKNNLQIVNSLLSLQTNQATSEEITEAYQSTMGRVWAMATVHETLYRSESITEIDLQQYLTMLAEQCLSLFRPGAGNVAIDVKADGVLLNIEQATPCGLIVNELVTNALKYAFTASRPGSITIGARAAENGDIVVEVRDDGPGLPDGLDWRQATSMGLTLVRLLAEGQLQGLVELDRTHGTGFIVIFKRKP